MANKHDNSGGPDGPAQPNDPLGAIDLQLQARRYACELLGVSELATKDELRQAYRRAALKYHPDRNDNNSENNRKFVLVKCAYELLMKGTPCLEITRLIYSWSIKGQSVVDRGNHSTRDNSSDKDNSSNECNSSNKANNNNKHNGTNNQNCNSNGNGNGGHNGNNKYDDRLKYNLDNPWGHFLWWKEKYFDGEYAPHKKGDE